MSWTPERIKILKKAWQQGKSASAIARDLGVSKNAVIGKMHRLNLSEKVKKVAQEVETKKEAYILPQNGVQLLDLKTNSCRWPIGEPTDSDFHFCGHEVVSGKPYCAKHCALAYTNVKEAKETKNTKRKDDVLDFELDDMNYEEENEIVQEKQEETEKTDTIHFKSENRKKKQKVQTDRKNILEVKEKNIEKKEDPFSDSVKDIISKKNKLKPIEENKVLKNTENSPQIKKSTGPKKITRKTLTIKRKEEIVSSTRERLKLQDSQKFEKPENVEKRTVVSKFLSKFMLKKP